MVWLGKDCFSDFNVVVSKLAKFSSPDCPGLLIHVKHVLTFHTFSIERYDMPDGGIPYQIWSPNDYSIKWLGKSLSTREVNMTAFAVIGLFNKILNKRSRKV